MARNRRSPRPAKPVAENSVLAEWERELLGYPPSQRPPRQTRAQRRSDEVRTSRETERRFLRAKQSFARAGRKPKTAEDAAYRRGNAARHKLGQLTSTGKPRKSRRSLKRELHSKSTALED